MTPLNCIQNFAEFIRERIIKLYSEILIKGSASVNSANSPNSNSNVTPSM